MTSTLESQASDWVVRRRAGLDAAAERELAAWLAIPEQRAAYDRLAAMAEVFQRARSQGAAITIVTQLESRTRTRRRRRRIATSVAVACLAATGVWWKITQPSRIAAPVVAEVFEPIRRLPDGSIVELKPGAEIAVRFEALIRRVDLVRGEALFRVEKDVARPFIVGAKGVDIRAVGTAFNVRLADTAVQVLVTEGKVRVEDAARGASLLPSVAASGAGEPVLTAGQAVQVEFERLAGPAQPLQVADLRPEEIQERLAWRTPRFAFEGMALGTALSQLNKFNRDQIVLADPGLAELRISGTFSPDDPDTFARLVAATFNLRVERRERELVLVRE